jgi:hypothetical protein
MTLGCDLPENALRKLGVGRVRAGLIRHLAQYVIDAMPLASLYPFSGGKWLDRKVNVPLILPYLSYRRYQIWRRLKQLNGQWKTQG